MHSESSSEQTDSSSSSSESSLETDSSTSSTESINSEQVELPVAHDVQPTEQVHGPTGQNGNVKLTISSKTATTNIIFCEKQRSLSMISQSVNESIFPGPQTNVMRFGKAAKKFVKEPIFKRKVSSSQPSGGQSASQPIGIKDPVPDQNVRN